MWIESTYVWFIDHVLIHDRLKYKSLIVVKKISWIECFFKLFISDVLIRWRTFKKIVTQTWGKYLNRIFLWNISLRYIYRWCNEIDMFASSSRNIWMQSWCKRYMRHMCSYYVIKLKYSLRVDQIISIESYSEFFVGHVCHRSCNTI